MQTPKIKSGKGADMAETRKQDFGIVELSWSDADALRMMLDRAIREDTDVESEADVIAASGILNRLTAAIHRAEVR